MQRLEQKSNQDVEQNTQKIDLIKKELQKYRELKKSPSFSNHLSSKQLLNCTEIEKRKKISTYINSNQIGQQNITLSQVNPPSSSRNFKDQQSYNQNKVIDVSTINSINTNNQQFENHHNYNYHTSAQMRNRNGQDRKQGNNSIDQNDRSSIEGKIISNTHQIIHSVGQNNKQYFREITLADVQNFDIENQSEEFNSEMKLQLSKQYKNSQQKQTLDAMYNQDLDEEMEINELDCKFGSQFDGSNLDAEDEQYQGLTFEDLKMKHKGGFQYQDIKDNKNEVLDKKNKKNLTLQNLEENHQQQSSWGSTLISSGRNDNERQQMHNNFSNLQIQSTKSQQNNFITSSNTLASYMSQKLQSIGSSRSRQSIIDQQSQTLKDCLSTSSNSKPTTLSNQTISSKATKTLSQDSQGFSEISHPRHLNVLPEFQDKLPIMNQELRMQYEEKDVKLSYKQNILNKNKGSMENSQQTRASPSNQFQQKNESQQITTQRRQSSSNSMSSPAVSPKNTSTKQNKYFNQDSKRAAVSSSVSPSSSSRNQNNKCINKDNKSRELSELQEKKYKLSNNYIHKNQTHLIHTNEKASTVKNTSFTNSNQQPYFKSIKMTNEKIQINSKQTNDKSNISLNKSNLNITINTQEKAKQFSQIGKQQKQNSSDNQSQQQQSMNNNIENLQSQKQRQIEQKISEEQERWKEFGSSMVLAYEELNQNFQLLVKQKKQQDVMLQQLVESLAQKDFEKSTQNLSPIKSHDDIQESGRDFNENNILNCLMSNENYELQLSEMISEIQSKLYKKFDKHDSMQIQTLLTQFNKYYNQNKILKSKQNEIQSIVNLQIKESSSLADQIIHLRTQLDKACITIMKNQKESNYQFSSMFQMLQQNKNGLFEQPQSQSIIIQDESFLQNIDSSQPQQCDQEQNFSLGSSFSPMNSKQNLNKAVYISNKQFQQSSNLLNMQYDEKEFKENISENILYNQKYQYNNQPSFNYSTSMKKSDSPQNQRFCVTINQIKGTNNIMQHDSFDVLSPIRNDRVPFFGEMINYSENKDEMRVKIS